jgi:hypothetical protein
MVIVSLPKKCSMDFDLFRKKKKIEKQNVFVLKNKYKTCFSIFLLTRYSKLEKKSKIGEKID